jgi:hypothetical protein
LRLSNIQLPKFSTCATTRADDMKKTAITILLLFVGALAAAAQDPEWIKYVSAEGRYEVRLPSQPELSTQDSTTTTGSKLKQYMALSGNGYHAFMVAYYDYDVVQTFSLDKARDGMIAGMQATLIREDQISLGAAPGRQLTIAVKVEGRDFVDVARLYDVTRRVYVLQCIFPKEEQGTSVVTGNCDKLFESFKATK